MSDERYEVIHGALHEVYGGWDKKPKPGTMVAACAKDLNERWEALKEKAAKYRDDNLGHEIMLVVWMWFPGGGTAEIASSKVLAAVEGVDPN